MRVNIMYEYPVFRFLRNNLIFIRKTPFAEYAICHIVSIITRITFSISGAGGSPPPPACCG
jgi:hypothetical protein